MSVKRIKAIIVAGARPNFMKVSPLLKAISEFNAREEPGADRVETLLVHTGQHYDENMSEVFFRELGIQPPDINLGVGSGSHAVQTAQIMMGFETLCVREKPDWVVVVGDVNSTMACTLVCAKMGIRVAHIEAGLRSFDRTMPEEINRLVTDALADLLLTPSEDADRNLLREGVAREKIRLIGNIMIDSLVENLPKARATDTLIRLGLVPHNYIYVTLHRPSNVDDRINLSALMIGLKEISLRCPVIFPAHPRTRKMLVEFGLMPRPGGTFFLLDPIGYHGSLCLTENATLVLTDSGGLQEEATYFRTPCLTLRPNTERPITITIGSNQLTSLESLVDDFQGLLKGPDRKGEIPPLWDGHTAGRALRSILEASVR